MRVLTLSLLVLSYSAPAAGDDNKYRPKPYYQSPPPTYTPPPPQPIFSEQSHQSYFPPTPMPPPNSERIILPSQNPYQGYQQGYSAPSGPWRPPPNTGGPERPPVMVDSELYSGPIRSYINSMAKKNGGVFLLKDEATGRLHKLKLKRLSNERIVRLGPDEAFACVDMETATGGTLDLDVYLARKDLGEWSVSKLLIHAVDGVARFVYDSSYQPTLPAGSVAAKAPSGSGERPPSGDAPTPLSAARIPKPKAPPQLSLQVALREPSGNDILDGGEAGSLVVSVANAGKGAAYALRLTPVLESEGRGLALEAAAIPEIKAGQSARAEIAVRAEEGAPSQQVRLKLEAREGNGFDAEPVEVRFEVRAFLAPKLEVAWVRLAGSAAVKAGEPTRASVVVRNAGKGAAREVSAILVIESADIFMAGEPAAALGSLKPGEAKTAEFEFFVNKRFKGTALPIAVSLTEARGRFGVARAPLGLALGKAPPAVRVYAVKGREEPAGAEAPAAEDVDSPPKARTPADPEAYAVVIGIERYRDLPGVDYAGRDAESVHTYLTRAMGFDARNVVILKDDRATLTDLDTYLGPWLEDRVTASSRVLIFYAGHGAPNPKTGEGYLIPYDGNPNYVETKGYPIKRLYATLAKLPAKDVTVVLDACFSGAGGRSVLAKGARPLVNVMQAPTAAKNMAVITAASREQISTSYPEGQHGMLTYFLLLGLRGAADADGDKQVTTGELFSYLRPAVEREARKKHVEQTPTLNPDPKALGARSARVWLKLR